MPFRLLALGQPQAREKVVTNIHRLWWTIVANIHPKKLIQMHELSKFLNWALCVGNMLILIREFGR